MVEKLTQAKTLFDKYSEQGASAILSSLPSLAEKTYESDWLDFKSGRAKDDDIRRIWSKAIGAFANSEGGVLIWGLSCYKDSVGVDAVNEVATVPDINVLKTRLMELRNSASDPPVAGIEIRTVPLSAEAKEGFVICLIPESTNKPHRSEFDSKQFYLRVGDSSKICNVSLLRQMFYPQRNIRLGVFLKSRQMPSGLGQQFRPADSNIWRNPRWALEIGVRNIGELTADDVRIGFRAGQEFSFAQCRWISLEQGYDIELAAEVQDMGLIHPSSSSSKIFVIFSVLSQPPLELKITVLARDTPRREAIIRWPEAIGGVTMNNQLSDNNIMAA